MKKLLIVLFFLIAVVGHAQNKLEYHIDPISSVELVDTTGAGDLFASGFLFGFTNKYSIQKCGYLGNKAASEIIKYIGARPKISLKSIL